MNYKKILNVVGVVAVTAVFSIGCSEKPDDDGGSTSGGGGGSKGNDINKYKTVQIGSQKWMAENLDNAVAGSVCYGNDPANCAKYGRLYDWNTAKTACPAGWHLPSDAEWTQLTDFVGGESTAGKKLKSTSGWNNNGNGTNDYQFSALPGGAGNGSGYFDYAGNNGHWWSSTENGANYAWGRYMFDEEEEVHRDDYADRTYQLSVRCVQN